MCGITGIKYRQSNKEIDINILNLMRDSLAHRGPDAAGYWISADKSTGLAHRRLSIIDLDQSAAQPMSNEDGNIRVVFNGEIYNHLELRRSLQKSGHRFRTDHSDTEVLVHGYEEWGISGLLKKIDGMFAFALWDSSKETLFVVRDRIGIKPVYFSIFDNTFLFASEIKALMKYPGLKTDIDVVAMYHYLSFLTTPAPLTMFKDIFKLPAGCYLEVPNRGRLSVSRYWDAFPGQSGIDAALYNLSAEAQRDFYIKSVRERLEKAVEKRMMSDVPFGAFLSGGIDSSVNVSLMDKYISGNIKTFTVGFSDHQHLNELEYAASVAKHFNTDHHEILINEKDMISYLDDLIYYQDEPIADWVCIPLYFLSKLAHDAGVKVVQVGEGSDEQFCGYSSYMGYLKLYRRYWSPFRKYLPKTLQKMCAGIALDIARYYAKFDVYADIIFRAAEDRGHFWSGATFFWESQKRQLVNFDKLEHSGFNEELKNIGLLPDNYGAFDSYEIIRSFHDSLNTANVDTDILNKMIYNEFKLRLPELLLMRVDKITMSTSLEARVPFLDYNLVELTMDIPMHIKIGNNEAKWLLKQAVSDLVPDEVINRKKMGFGAPMDKWLKGNFGKIVESTLLKSQLLKRGFFNEHYIKMLLKQHRENKKNNSGYIWLLFNLCTWYDRWIACEPSRVS